MLVEICVFFFNFHNNYLNEYHFHEWETIEIMRKYSKLMRNKEK